MVTDGPVAEIILSTSVGKYNTGVYTIRETHEGVCTERVGRTFRSLYRKGGPCKSLYSKGRPC